MASWRISNIDPTISTFLIIHKGLKNTKSFGNTLVQGAQPYEKDRICVLTSKRDQSCTINPRSNLALVDIGSMID